MGSIGEELKKKSIIQRWYEENDKKPENLMMVLSSVMIQLLYSIKMFLTQMVEKRRRKKFIEFVAFLKNTITNGIR